MPALLWHFRELKAVYGDVRVEDNGCGFSPDRFSKADGRPRGFGLSGMKERVLYSGGSWQLWPRPLCTVRRQKNTVYYV
jgi:glucose-6-phosphate-specific signal transduction histidine kinase